MTLIITRHASKKTFTIGILQTASHPALDAVRTSLIANLRENLGKDLRVVSYNAEGMLPLAEAAARSLRGNHHMCAIVTIGTLATQTMLRKEPKVPIIFSAVSDTASLGLVPLNVCGVTDNVESSYVISSVQKLVPKARDIALLYNPAEANSAASILTLQESIKKASLTPILIGVSGEADCPLASRSAFQRADVVIAPQDNTIASALSQVAREAVKAKKPLLICYKTKLPEGVLAALGSEYEEIGTQAAQMAISLVRSQKTPESWSVVTPHPSTIRVHRKTAQGLELKISDEMLSQIEWEESA